MKQMVFFVVSFLLLAAGSAEAQESQTKQTRQEKKMLEEAQDSLRFEEALHALQQKDFTLEADQVIFKYGETAYVDSNTNFVSVSGQNATVQVAFNIPASGPNGLGGVTVDGQISSYEMTTDKKGNVQLTMNVMGSGISARVVISMAKGANRATLDIFPNFSSNRLSLRGVLLPSEQSNVFKGRSF